MKPVYETIQIGASLVDVTSLIDEDVKASVDKLDGYYIDLPTLLELQKISLLRKILTELEMSRKGW